MGPTLVQVKKEWKEGKTDRSGGPEALTVTERGFSEDRTVPTESKNERSWHLTKNA